MVNFFYFIIVPKYKFLVSNLIAMEIDVSWLVFVCVFYLQAMQLNTCSTSLTCLSSNFTIYGKSNTNVLSLYPVSILEGVCISIYIFLRGL